MYRNIFLKKGKEDSLRRFHPWVFSGAIGKVDDNIKDGDVVRVLTNDGEFIAVGHYQRGTITVRVLSFEDKEVNIDFWEDKLKSAYAVRESLGLVQREDTDTFRLVHGEGDNREQ